MFVALFVYGSFGGALACLLPVLAALAMYVGAVVMKFRSLPIARRTQITYLNLGLCGVVWLLAALGIYLAFSAAFILAAIR